MSDLRRTEKSRQQRHSKSNSAVQHTWRQLARAFPSRAGAWFATVTPLVVSASVGARNSPPVHAYHTRLLPSPGQVGGAAGGKA